MNLKALVTLNAVVGLVFGVALLLAPQLVLATNGLGADATTLVITRLLGAEFLGFNLVSLLIRNRVGESSIGRSLVIGRCVSEGSGFVVAFLGKLAGVGNSLVWGIVAVYGLFAVAFFIFLVRGQAAYKQG